MHPILFQLGPLSIPTYGFFSLLALISGLWLVYRYARVEGLNPSATTEAIFLTIAVGVVGARVLELIINFRRYFETPGGLKLALLSGGVFLGGIIAAVSFGVYYFRRLRIPYLQGLDLLSLCGAVAEAVGRWGCFFSGCCWGTPTDLPWAVTFPALARRLHAGLPAVPIHPTQIYMSLTSWAILGVLVLLYRRKRFHGQLITVYLILYTVARFFLEFVRGDEERGFVFGGLMSTSQFLGLLIAMAALLAYVALDRRHKSSREPDWRAART